MHANPNFVHAIVTLFDPGSNTVTSLVVGLAVGCSLVTGVAVGLPLSDTYVGAGSDEDLQNCFGSSSGVLGTVELPNP